MTAMLMPATCPRCGEKQNQLAPGFNLERQPFGGVICKICGHEFSEQEYRCGLAKASAEFETRRAQGPRPGASSRLA